MDGFRSTDPSTSKEAFESANVNLLESRVLDALRAMGEKGGTAEEIAELLNISLQSVTPRIKPLETKGLVYRNGDRRRGKFNTSRLVVRLTRIGILSQPTEQ
jgi:DNA-binding MarR family transcriptional regulator